MENIIKVSSLLTVLCTSAVLILTGMRDHGLDIQQAYISIAVNLMYSFFILAAILILYKEFKSGDKKWLIAFGIPIDILILSVILAVFDIRFHPSILFAFNVYLLIVFSFYMGAVYYTKSEEKTMTKNAKL